MRKTSTILLALALVSVMVMGCPDPSDPGTNDDVRLGQSDAGQEVKEKMAELGYNVEVSVWDIDENGASDYDIRYVSGNEKEQIIIFLANITGTVGSIDRFLTWNADKVVVSVGKTIYLAQVSDCVKCVNLLDSATDEQVVDCLYNSWYEISPDKGEEKDKIDTEEELWQ